ncbi:conserved hypothetical protein [uncultured Mycobacterium sp.]|uniref:DUF7159 domain-containing protein n=1 Tax=uncultured Mycobacterium sp. TaxID=171292 RepID=A0A1Y5PDG4_9MYCO|nr:conserved hypothetical protein [uncultured Mycobacterium sp.]
MDVALGVAVTGPSARLALLDFDTGDVLDESDFALSSDPVGHLHTAIAGTHRTLHEGDHRLVATRLYWPDQVQAQGLARALTQSGLDDVTTISGAEAATALVRGAARNGECALLFVDEDTATLSIVGADAVTTSVIAAEAYSGADPVPACATLLRRLAEEPGAATGVYLVATSGDPKLVAAGLRSKLPLAVPDHPAFAIARGAAAAAHTSAATAPAQPAAVRVRVRQRTPVAAAVAAPAVATEESPLIGSNLAYSMAYDSGPLSIEDPARYPRDSVPLQRAMHPLSYTSDPTEVDSAVAPAARPQVLLVGSAAAAVAVVALAGLAVVVALGIRPQTIAQPVFSAYETDQGPVKGKFGAVVPMLEQKPDVVMPDAVAIPDAVSDGGYKVVYSSGGGIPSGGPIHLPVSVPAPPVEAVPAPGLPQPGIVLPPFKLPPPPPIIVQLPPPGPIKLPPPPVIKLPPPPPPIKLPPPPVIKLPPPPPPIKLPPPPPPPKLPPPPVIKLPPPPVIKLPPPPKIPRICVPMLPCVGG